MHSGVIHGQYLKLLISYTVYYVLPGELKMGMGMMFKSIDFRPYWVSLSSISLLNFFHYSEIIYKVYGRDLVDYFQSFMQLGVG